MQIWTDKDVFPIFFAIWVLLAIGGYFFLDYKKNAEFKRRWHPRFVIFAGLLFICFVFILTSLNPRKSNSLGEMFFAVPFVILIIFLNIRMTKFCSKCGKTIYSRSFSIPKFCSNCGASLDGTK